MSVLLNLLYVAAAIAVVAEGLNKLERTDLSREALAGATRAEIAAAALRAVGWLCMVLAGCGLVFASQVPREYVEAGYALAVIGSGCLVVRARIQEVVHDKRLHLVRGIDPDAFARTQAISGDQLRAALLASTLMPDPNRDRTEERLRQLQREQEAWRTRGGQR